MLKIISDYCPYPKSRKEYKLGKPYVFQDVILIFISNNKIHIKGVCIYRTEKYEMDRTVGYTLYGINQKFLDFYNYIIIKY